jgi:hypothetical protein
VETTCGSSRASCARACSPEVLSGTLQVRFQAYNYVAFLARYGQSISVVQGTGLASPTYAGDTSITF